MQHSRAHPSHLYLYARNEKAEAPIDAAALTAINNSVNSGGGAPARMVGYATTSVTKQTVSTTTRPTDNNGQERRITDYVYGHAHEADEADEADHHDTTTTLPHIDVPHSLGEYGLLQAMTLDDHCLNALRDLCHETPCDAVHSNAQTLFSPETLALLQQGYTDAPCALAKLPDGYLLFVPSEKNRLLSVIKDAHLHKQRGDPSPVASIAPNKARVVAYSIVLPPQHESKVKGFYTVFHDGATDAHEISRFGCVDHCVAQVAAALPLTDTPRIIFQAEGLGTLLGQTLLGEGADLVKQTFLQLVQHGTALNNGVYDVPIKTSDTLARLLQFDSSAALGHIALGRLHDGLFAFRNRPDGRKAFLFTATCDEFHSKKPRPVGDSRLQIFRMVYDGNKPDDPRFFIHVPTNRNELPSSADVRRSPMVPGCPLGLPYILPNIDTVQSLLNLVERGMRIADRKARKCGDFPQFCTREAIDRVRTNTPVDTLNALAMREALKTYDHAPPGRVWIRVMDNNNNNNAATTADL